MGMRVLAQAPFVGLHFGQELAREGTGVVVQRVEDAEQADGRGGGIGAATFHHVHFHEAAVVATPCADELDQRLGIGRGLLDQLLAQDDQEAVIDAAGLAQLGFGVTAVGAAQRFERGRHALLPAGGLGAEDVDAGGQFEHLGAIDQRQKVDNGHVVGQPCLEEGGGARGGFAFELAQQRQPSQAERRVVQVAGAFAAGESAVGLLRGEQIVGVPLSKRSGQSAQALGETKREVLQIHGRPVGTRGTRAGRHSAAACASFSAIHGGMGTDLGVPSLSKRQQTVVVCPLATGRPASEKVHS